MKSQVLIFVLIVAATTQSLGQIFCLSGKEFDYPDIARRAGIEPSFLVRYDIVGFVPSNFRIQLLDSTKSEHFHLTKSEYVHLFSTALISNLTRLTYLKDSVDYELIARFRIRPERWLSTDYIEAISDHEVHFVSRPGSFQLFGDPGVRLPDPGIDSVFLDSVVQYRSGPVRKSDILVERRFDHDEGTTIILRNNFPDLADDIRLIAARYSKERFLGVGSNATKYFVRFRVERELPGCGGKAIY